MKELRISAYNVELASPFDNGTGVPVRVINYTVEIIRDIPRAPYNALRIGVYGLELLQPYIAEEGPESSINPPYYFTGVVEDDLGPVEREVISYERSTYKKMDTSISDPDGSFFLDSTTSGTCFLVCLDDDGGVDYNHLVAAVVKPALFDDYGMSSNNPGQSAKDILEHNTAATYDGLYWIQPPGYDQPVQIFCDMTTHGGGWTMCARWDRDFPTDWISCLPLGAMRSNINVTDMVYTNEVGSFQSATINIIPTISGGATTFMHRSMDLDDRYWKHTYFSDIYKVVRESPENIFNPSFDTNVGETLVGISTTKSHLDNTMWYDSNMDLLSSYDLNNTSYNYCLKGGEGDAMFVLGTTAGAVYASHPLDTATSTGNDHVFWGFYGKDGSVSSLTSTYSPRVGTNESLTYSPACRFNFMFIR